MYILKKKKKKKNIGLHKKTYRFHSNRPHVLNGDRVYTQYIKHISACDQYILTKLVPMKA